jgi:hypothetical protein
MSFASPLTLPPSEILQKFGFEPTEMFGFYQTNFKPGIISTLIFTKGVLSIYEENEDGTPINNEADQSFKMNRIPVANETELEFLLLKALN